MRRAGRHERGAGGLRAAKQERGDPGVRDLLDHLGRLLAEEYVERLHDPRVPTTSRKKEAP